MRNPGRGRLRRGLPTEGHQGGPQPVGVVLGDLDAAHRGRVGERTTTDSHQRRTDAIQ